MTYTQDVIDGLISSPKRILEAPKRQMKLVGADWRNDCKLVAEGVDGEFSIFMRRSEDFAENFSIGIVYDPKDGSGDIMLVRCNGPHGGFNDSFKLTHPHWGYHIHRATEAAIADGFKPEKYAEQTEEYASFEEAVQHFVKLVNLNPVDAKRHFPDRTAQGALFEEGSQS